MSGDDFLEVEIDVDHIALNDNADVRKLHIEKVDSLM